MSEDKILPCRKCGSDDIDMWDGMGTQASMYCVECGHTEEVQVSDVLSYEERFSGNHDFSMETLQYPAATVARAKDELIKEWNARHYDIRQQLAFGCDVDKVTVENLERAIKMLRTAESILKHTEHDVYHSEIEDIEMSLAPFKREVG